MTSADSVPDVPQPARRPGELYRFVSEPTELQGAARRHLRIVIISLALAVLAGVGLAVFPRLAVQLWILLGVSVAAALVYLLLFTTARAGGNYRGDDLIDLILVPEGFVTQGGFAISWDEVSKVEVQRHVPKKVKGGSMGQRIGASAAARLLEHGGSDVSVRIHLRDCKAALARATTKRQKFALIDAVGGTEGFALAALGLQPIERINEFLPLLQRECAAHNVPLQTAQ